MPYLSLGLHIGDADSDGAVGPPINGVLRMESGPYLNCEDGSWLAFD